MPLLASATAFGDGPATGGTEYAEPGGPAGESRLLSRRNELLGSTLAFKGSLAGTQPGDTVEVQRLDRKAGWVPVTTTFVGAEGMFYATWRTDTIGRTTVRAVPAAIAGDARAASIAPVRQVTVFRSAIATWYGPGFYGRATACGRRMTTRLLGVAHPKLPCGTQVDLLYKGRSITVPVVDRGPFRPGTSWDLTRATARALRFTATDTIGAVRVREAPAA
jgi:hypothetical protein